MRSLVLVTALIAGTAAAGDPPLPLEKLGDYPLTGGATRWDYQAFDPRRHLLFIAHLGDGALTVFDAQANKVTRDIAKLSQAHGVLVVPELDRVYVSATGTHELVAIDGKDLRASQRVVAGKYPDGIAYAPGAKKLYVSDEFGASEIVIDAAAHKVVKTLPLGGEAGNSQFDPVSKHVFVNVQTRGDLVEIDPVSDAIVGRHAIEGAEGNHGLLIEPEQRVAFIGCEGNGKLIVFDLAKKRVAASFAAGGEPDVLAWDPGLHVLYVASEDGVVAMFRAEHGTVTKVWQGVVGPNAHSVAVDPETHRVYFPLKNVGGRPVLRVMVPTIH